MWFNLIKWDFLGQRSGKFGLFQVRTLFGLAKVWSCAVLRWSLRSRSVWQHVSSVLEKFNLKELTNRTWTSSVELKKNQKAVWCSCFFFLSLWDLWTHWRFRVFFFSFRTSFQFMNRFLFNLRSKKDTFCRCPRCSARARRAVSPCHGEILRVAQDRCRRVQREVFGQLGVGLCEGLRGRRTFEGNAPWIRSGDEYGEVGEKDATLGGHRSIFPFTKPGFLGILKAYKRFMMKTKEVSSIRFGERKAKSRPFIVLQMVPPGSLAEIRSLQAKKHFAPSHWDPKVQLSKSPDWRKQCKQCSMFVARFGQPWAGLTKTKKSKA